MAGKQVYDAAFAQALGAVERGLVPDAVVRAGIRWLLTQRKREVRWRYVVYQRSVVRFWQLCVVHRTGSCAVPGLCCCMVCAAVW